MVSPGEASKAKRQGQAIGQTLKLIRVRAHLSQCALAQQLGVTANWLSLVEHGHRDPSLTFLRTFAKHLNVPLGYYLWLALADDDVQEPSPCP